MIDYRQLGRGEARCQVCTEGTSAADPQCAYEKDGIEYCGAPAFVELMWADDIRLPMCSDCYEHAHGRDGDMPTVDALREQWQCESK